jgi:hypothetical protein
MKLIAHNCMCCTHMYMQHGMKSDIYIKQKVSTSTIYPTLPHSLPGLKQSIFQGLVTCLSCIQLFLHDIKVHFFLHVQTPFKKYLNVVNKVYKYIKVARFCTYISMHYIVRILKYFMFIYVIAL